MKDSIPILLDIIFAIALQFLLTSLLVYCVCLLVNYNFTWALATIIYIIIGLIKTIF